MFPVNLALSGTFNSCMWATVHLSKDEDDFKRAIQHVEVRKIETNFEMVQAQISNHWARRTSGVDKWSLEKVFFAGRVTP